MAARLPIVCIFGAESVTLRSEPAARRSETTELDCRCFAGDDDLERILITVDPHVIVTVGSLDRFPRLMAAPFDIRRRWLHYPDLSDLDRMGTDAFHCYLSVCLDRREEQPLVSLFTPTYRTGKRFLRAHRSVLAQTYTNWEWVVWDDSDDDGETAAMVEALAAADHRIRLIRPQRHSGVIGEVKYNACMACRGDLLAELDHDDELTPNALEDLVAAARKYPQCGFFYTDWCEVNGAMGSLTYDDGWGWGYGSYRTEQYRGYLLSVVNSPNINGKTIRGLVAAPNHLRAWRRSTYLEVGGHNRLLHICDDMDLMIRSFLATTFCRIPKLGYLQYMEGANTQSLRNADIQRHVRYLAWKYDRAIHDRFRVLGVHDFVWNEREGRSDFSIPNPKREPVASIIAEL